MPTEEKIVIRYVGRPHRENTDELIKWFCKAFGFGEGDDELEHALFRTVISSTLSGEGITSKDLNEKLEMPRSTVIYHLNRFISSGLIVRKGRKYQLRSDSLADTFEEMRQDIENEFDRLTRYAEVFDMNFNDVYGSTRQEPGRIAGKKTGKRLAAAREGRKAARRPGSKG